ncbi:hypothetical protein EJM73_09535 [Clostridium botulinum]|uniref:hypothetical protein n=1 Tax=Clostridium botulinum TaxID=1491 RepID=UPI0013763F9D|nr:hypothetical protein [Clostridium botulinum]NCI19867.1 hypothetical protein [Clostridium botulinum]NCI35905.1 hypothetical protein [Clostridium botulinum]NCI71762.1 hypothetical protein [Clostridium botulinum]NDI38678.1 hypothetical protein [Clostridium botulinum]
MKKIIKRPNSVLKSTEISFKEIQDFKKGNKKFKSLKESQQLWDKWVEESENEDNEEDIIENLNKETKE